MLLRHKPTIDRFAVHKYLNYKIAGENAPYLHLSLLLNDCIARGKSLQEGGAVYNFTGPQGFGIANVTDSLLAVKKRRALPECFQRNVRHHQLCRQPDGH